MVPIDTKLLPLMEWALRGKRPTNLDRRNCFFAFVRKCLGEFPTLRFWSVQARLQLVVAPKIIETINQRKTVSTTTWICIYFQPFLFPRTSSSKKVDTYHDVFFSAIVLLDMVVGLFLGPWRSMRKDSSRINGRSSDGFQQRWFFVRWWWHYEGRRHETCKDVHFLFVLKYVVVVVRRRHGGVVEG